MPAASRVPALRLKEKLHGFVDKARSSDDASAKCSSARYPVPPRLLSQSIWYS